MIKVTNVEKLDVRKMLKVFSTYYKLNNEHFYMGLTNCFYLIKLFFKHNFQYINIISIKGVTL